MGLFSNTEPKPMTALEASASGGADLARAFSPMLESFGYQSQENQILDIMRGVDTSDIDSFNQAYKQMLGIDPEAAAEFKSQVLPMMKDTQDYKKSSLELKALENKPQLTSQWQYQGKPNYMAWWVKDRFGVDISPVNAKLTDISKIIRAQAKGDAGLAGNWKKDFNADLKAAQDTFMISNALTDFSQGQGQGQTQGGYSMPTGYLDKPVVDPANVSTEGAGYSNISGITQIDPNASALGETYQKSEVASDVLTRVHKVRYSLDSIRDKTHTFEKNMPKDMLIRENKIDYIEDWLGREDFVGSGSGGGEGFKYFMNNPKELELFEKNPILWFFSKGPGKDLDKDFSKHQYFGN